ncbi:MAG: hypothetical protein HUN04_22060 [Desulfobacter sp.]|nr:MAG: hypothetical protein HUN04_22060 [Desulfobacter sp.]
MNSLTRTSKIAGTAVIISMWAILFSVYAAAQETGMAPFNPVYELTPEQDAAMAQKAKQAAISAAADLLEKTRIWKRVDRIREGIIKRYSFEFRKSFSKTENPGAARKNGTDRKKEKSGEFVFSGGLGPDMTPALSFSSGFRPANIALKFDVLDQELDCEISSRPVNRLMGGRTSLGLSSDGGVSRAMLKISFDF